MAPGECVDSNMGLLADGIKFGPLQRFCNLKMVGNDTKVLAVGLCHWTDGTQEKGGEFPWEGAVGPPLLDSGTRVSVLNLLSSYFRLLLLMTGRNP